MVTACDHCYRSGDAFGAPNAVDPARIVADGRTTAVQRGYNRSRQTVSVCPSTTVTAALLWTTRPPGPCYDRCLVCSFAAARPASRKALIVVASLFHSLTFTTRLRRETFPRALGQLSTEGRL
ncbi:MAG: hypothetical protein J07HX5_01067 [halophilic archaeon J07HX5]|nr:MAG: hypothetical protein J07HX5_01067 [halophilic archaeon J07HX5]